MPKAEKIVKAGKVVLSYSWDSGGFRYGIEQVFCLEGLYAVDSDLEGALGPFESLLEAIDQTDVLSISDAGESIECDELTVSQIIDALQPIFDGNGPILEINGTTCEFDAESQHYFAREA